MKRMFANGLAIALMASFEFLSGRAGSNQRLFLRIRLHLRLQMLYFNPRIHLSPLQLPSAGFAASLLMCRMNTLLIIHSSDTGYIFWMLIIYLDWSRLFPIRIMTWWLWIMFLHKKAMKMKAWRR